MGRAYSRQPARDNLAALGHELLQQAHIFVVDGVNFFHAEFANFLAPEKLAAAAFAAATASGTGTPLAPAAAAAAFRLFCLRCLYFFVCHDFLNSLFNLTGAAARAGC